MAFLTNIFGEQIYMKLEKKIAASKRIIHFMFLEQYKLFYIALIALNMCQ